MARPAPQNLSTTKMTRDSAHGSQTLGSVARSIVDRSRTNYGSVRTASVVETSSGRTARLESRTVAGRSRRRRGVRARNEGAVEASRWPDEGAVDAAEVDVRVVVVMEVAVVVDGVVGVVLRVC
jgi:hypothetical protein